jgi:hypothetical protein
MILIPDSREPLFASNVKRKGQYVMYFDKDGMPACVNVAARPGFRQCCICKNCCISFVVDDTTGEYTCSACGKFPREMLVSN